jgi:hypothetical protein
MHLHDRFHPYFHRCNIKLNSKAYIKENRILYENFILDDLDSFCQREVEAVDIECDHVQIIAVTNVFEIGVIIENLGNKSIETIKFPEDASSIFIHMFFRPGHYDILYN